jgi:hypothetical protein
MVRGERIVSTVGIDSYYPTATGRCSPLPRSVTWGWKSSVNHVGMRVEQM